MHRSIVQPLKFLSKSIDAVARVGQHRFVREKSTGIAYGETELRRALKFLGIDTVFDVGANMGQYAQQLRSVLSYHGRILSFEPIPDAAESLRELSAKDPGWTIHECAIDDTPGKAQFNIMRGSEFSSLLAPSADFEGKFHGLHHVERTVDVDVVTLAQAVQSGPPFERALLKLDTQGNELRILRGSTDVLPRFCAIQLETGFRPIYAGEGGFEEVVSALRGWGYEVCSIFPNNHGHFPHLLEMDAIFIRRELLPPLP